MRAIDSETKIPLIAAFQRILHKKWDTNAVAISSHLKILTNSRIPKIKVIPCFILSSFSKAKEVMMYVSADRKEATHTITLLQVKGLKLTFHKVHFNCKAILAHQIKQRFHIQIYIILKNLDK